jgi:hypothetical protein
MDKALMAQMVARSLSTPYSGSKWNLPARIRGHIRQKKLQRYADLAVEGDRVIFLSHSGGNFKADNAAHAELHRRNSVRLQRPEDKGKWKPATLQPPKFIIRPWNVFKRMLERVKGEETVLEDLVEKNISNRVVKQKAHIKSDGQWDTNDRLSRYTAINYDGELYIVENTSKKNPNNPILTSKAIDKLVEQGVVNKNWKKEIGQEVIDS